MITDRDIARAKRAYKAIKTQIAKIRDVAERTDGMDRIYLSNALSHLDQAQGLIGETWQ